MLEATNSQNNVGTASDQNLHPEKPKSKLHRFFSSAWLSIVLIINGMVLVPVVIMIVSMPFLGPAAILPAILLTAFFPVIGVLLIADFVILTIFLFVRVIRRNFTRPWIFLGALGLWLILLMSIVPLVRGTIRSTQDRIDQKKGQVLLSKAEAVQLIQSCKIASFYQAGSGGTSPGDKLVLTYKDMNLQVQQKIQKTTDPKNFDTLLAEARKSANNCGKVTYNCYSEGYDIGSAEPYDYCQGAQKLSERKDKDTCEYLWDSNNKKPQTDLVALGTPVSDGITTVKVVRAIFSPNTTGEPPDAGTMYLEVDLSITGASQAPLIIYLPSSYPSCSITGMGVVDKGSGYLHPVTQVIKSAKKVSIPGKTSIVSYSASTTQVYALFEVQVGDKGYVSWTDSKGTSHYLALQ